MALVVLLLVAVMEQLQLVLGRRRLPQQPLWQRWALAPVMARSVREVTMMEVMAEEMVAEAL